MKKIMILFILPFVLSISACASGQDTSTPDNVFVTFKNYDDTVLYHTKVEYGTNVSYLGKAPTKEATVDKYYTFLGWDKDINQKIYENTIFYAQYTEEIRKYIVTFKNYDDTVLATANVTYGSYASFDYPSPSKPSNDDRIDYSFSGWDKDLESTKIVEDTTFKAQYITNHYVYATFLNYDQTELQKVKTLVGTIPSYTGITPTKPSNDDRIEYEFIAWDKTLSTISIDTTYIAQYKINEYIYASFYNYDNTLLQRIKIQKGDKPIYTGSTPSRLYSGSDKAYKFIGWDKSLSSITEDTTYIAQFDLLNVYIVTFKNYDDTILQTKKVIHGDDVTYTGPTPYRSSKSSGDRIVTYTFDGWSGSLENITSNITLIAKFSISTKVIGATAIREHLDRYGTGSYHNVETNFGSGGVSTLGYSDSDFFLGYTNISVSIETYMSISFRFGETEGLGLFKIYDDSVLMFSATYNVYASNHKFSSIECVSISINKYTTDDEISAAAALTILSAKMAMNDASEYLSDHGLDYIF